MIQTGELRVLLKRSGALLGDAQLALEQAALHHVAAAGQVGADCGHAHGLNAVSLHKLRLLLGVLLDHLQELDIQGVQELLCHLGLLPAEGGQGRQPLLGDGKGVELGAAHAGTDQIFE